MGFDKRFNLILVIFVTGLLTANVTANRVGGIGLLSFAGSPICFGATFLLCDVVNELYGKSSAQYLIRMGLFANICMLFFLYSVRLFPAADFATEQNHAFNILFTTSWRIVLASQVSYFIGNMVDIAVFDWLRGIIPAYRGVRKNLSTWISQIVDSGIFCSVAFLGIFSSGEIWAIFFSEYILKVMLSLIDTPLFYLITKILVEDKRNVRGN